MKRIKQLIIAIVIALLTVSCNTGGSGMAEANYEGIFTHDVSFDPVTARYFKVTVKTSVIPEWHPGKGGKGFIFVDEIRLD